MKKLVLTLLTLVIATISFSQFKVPTRNGKWIHDYENILTQSQVSDLKSQIKTMFDSSSMEVAVVILNDLQDHTIEEAALAIGRTWGVGQKDMNNGIVYLISPVNRKARLEVGYGLEGDVSDVTAQEIGDGATQYYKNNDYYGGIQYVLTKLNHRLDRTYKVQQAQKEEQTRKENKRFLITIGAIIMWVFIVILIVLGIIFILKKRSKYRSIKKALNELYLNINNRYLDITNKFTFNFLKYETSGQYDDFLLNRVKISALITHLENRPFYKSTEDIQNEYEMLNNLISKNDIYKGEQYLSEEITNYNSAKKENPGLIEEIKALFETYYIYLNKYPQRDEKKLSLTNISNQISHFKSETSINQALKTLKSDIIEYLTFHVPECDLYQQRIQVLKSQYSPLIDEQKNKITIVYNQYGTELSQIIALASLLVISEDENYQNRYNEISMSYNKLIGIITNNVPASNEYKARIAEEKRKREQEEEEERASKRREAEDEERRRNSYNNDSSMGGGYGGGSFGGGGGGGDYGGGSFGGGGANSSW